MIIRRSANFRLANSSKYLDFGLVRRKRDHRKKIQELCRIGKPGTAPYLGWKQLLKIDEQTIGTH